MADKLSLMFKKLLDEYSTEYEKASKDKKYRIPLDNLAKHDIVEE